MAAKFRHIAFMSQNAPRLRLFYESLFNMKRPKSEIPSPEADAAGLAFGYPMLASKHLAKAFNNTVWGLDGNIGVAFLRRRPGYRGGMDHFGFEVDDIESVCARIKEKYPGIGVVKRPAARTFAAYSTHDLEGNIFDLAQPSGEKRYQNWAGQETPPARYISHFTIRAMNPAALSDFYVDAYGLQAESKALEDPNFYVTDGKVTLVLAPWKIEDYRETEHRGPGLDHVGFKVESLDAFKQDVEILREVDPEWLSPQAPNLVSEHKVVVGLLASCRHGQHQVADPEGNFLDVSE